MFLYIKNISFASPSLFCITTPDALSVCLSFQSKFAENLLFSYHVSMVKVILMHFFLIYL